MIVFCEDCGEKNLITQDQFKAGRAVFKCTACNYNNNYLLSSTHPSDNGNIIDHLKKIISIPDTLGGFVYHLEKGILKHNMPASFKKENLIGLGHILSQNLLVCLSNYSDVGRMTLYLAKRHMVVQVVETDMVIILVCASKKSVTKVEDYLDKFKEAFIT